MSDVAQALGLRLKAERERRGMSAQKIADDMHLDGWVIEALEAGDYQRIGPSVYAKGHLKKYATLLGVSAVDSPPVQAKQPPGGSPVPIIRLDQPASGSRVPGRVLAGAAVAAALVGGAVWLRPWQGGPKPPATKSVSTETVPSKAVSTENAASDAALPAIPAESAPASAVSANLAAASKTPSSAVPALLQTALKSNASPKSDAPDLTPGVGRARLRLSFSADSRVDVYDFSGKHIFSGNGRANSVTTIAGIAPFRVYLGFASGVQLEVNHRAVAIGPQFVSGDVARFEAGADGVLRRETPPAPNNGAAPATASPRG
jgi:cytoskeleton protein RodZ